MAIEPTLEAGDAATIRSFVAIELDAAMRGAVAAAIRALREGPGGDGFRWARPETLHVTLAFLGDIDPARVPALGSALRAEVADVEPFTLTLGELGAFPSLRRPQVLFLRVGPEPRLEALAGAVERAMVQAGFVTEARPYRPHLTLGRARRGKSARVTASVTTPGESRVVDEIVLFRSDLAPSGATHTPLDRIAVGTGNGIGRSHHP